MTDQLNNEQIIALSIMGGLLGIILGVFYYERVRCRGLVDWAMISIREAPPPITPAPLETIVVELPMLSPIKIHQRINIIDNSLQILPLEVTGIIYDYLHYYV